MLCIMESPSLFDIYCPNCQSKICELNHLLSDEVADLVARRVSLVCLDCGKVVNK